MPRIPDAELERLKTEVPVERLMEASGVVLRRTGKDLLGKCPFHEDGEPSLQVTPARNLWHCFSCQIGGGPIDWVMRTEKVSFRHAVELLRNEFLPGEEAPSPRTIRAIPSVLALDADDQALLSQVVDFYHQTLKDSPEALDYLKSRGIPSAEAVERFKLGYANRTLGYSLPEKQVKAGAELRGRLQKVGLYRESGHEHFSGSLVVPVLGPSGEVLELYGRKTRDDLRKGTPKHLYLPGPHRGVWNLDGLRGAKEVILCEALIDALTFWCAGFRNVTAAYGVEGFTGDHLAALETFGVERVLIAFDRDEAGDRAAHKLAEKLMARGFACSRINFPKGMDANEYALKVTPASKSLGLLIRTAEWMGNGKAPASQETQAEPGSSLDALPFSAASFKPPPPPQAAAQLPGPVHRPPPCIGQRPALSSRSQLLADMEPPPTPPRVPGHEGDAPTPGSVPAPPAPGEELPHEIQGQDLFLSLGDRRYRVRGWQKMLSPEVLKVNLRVSSGDRFHVDTLDLYQAKARAAFLRQAGQELGEGEETLKADLGQVLRKVEALQGDALAQALAEKAQRPAMSEAEQAEALGLLKAPDLLQRILADFEALGVVGEEPNKLTGYLAAVSRLLDRPLALLIQSASAAGKSSLMDAVLDLIPEEDVVRYSAMSGQSVFYMGDKGLQHRILAIAEEEGAKQASYALKLLQSEGRVTMASTGKNPATGMLETHDYTVEGPVMLFLTTTAIDLDEELLNRCLVLTVNESREQTRAIHALQRSRETLDGWLAKDQRDHLLRLHRNAQRLLQPLAVVNPYAERLKFRDDQTRSRRDHVKYLTLIRAIALLHQHQREIKAHGSFRYIEVTPSDIRLANELAEEVFSRTVDELLPQTRKLLVLLHGWVRESCEREGVAQGDFHFTRRQAREALGWGDTQLWTHLTRLVELEFLGVHRGQGGKTLLYELRYEGGRPACALGLIEAEALGTTDQIRGPVPQIRGEGPNDSGVIRGIFGGDSAHIRGVSMGQESSDDAGSGANLNGRPENAHKGFLTPVPSYPVNGHPVGGR